MKFPAGCFCACGAAVRFSSVGGAIEVRSIASEPARKKHGGTDKGKHDDAIRQLHVVAPCTPSGIAGTELDGSA
jgi:hypothetical protein